MQNGCCEWKGREETWLTVHRV